MLWKYKNTPKIIFLLIVGIELTFSVAIYRDIDVIKKSHRAGRQFNDFSSYEDDFSLSRYKGNEQSKWESAEDWPTDKRGRREESIEYEVRPPYDWYYYNKFITNGRFNHLYNGPHLDNFAGIGHSGKNPPKILPRPAPIGRSFAYQVQP